MFNLRTIFNTLPLPLKSKEGYFSAQSINGYSNHHIAKNYLGHPSLLIHISEKKQDFLIQNQHLYNLNISHNLICEVEVDGIISPKIFSVITYIGHDSDMKNIFLSICETLLHSLGIKPSNQTIKSTVEKLIELFKSLQETPKKSIQGLWAELLLIDLSKFPEKIINGWHNAPEEKFDFNFGKVFLEVKSTSKNTRQHHFSFEQLIPPKKHEIIIASIIMSTQAGGISLEKMIYRIVKRLAKYPKQKEKLLHLISSTLGSNFRKIHHIEYNYKQAVDSLKFFNAIDIPSISPLGIPKEVTNIKFVSDLENVKAIQFNINKIIT